MPSPSDADVLETAMAFRDALARVIAGQLREPADRDDVVQETILRLMKSDLSSIRNVEAWMTTVAKRLAVDRLRAKKESRGDLAVTTTDERDPIAERDLQRLRSCLLAHLDHLDADERRLLEASDVEGVHRDQMAQDLGLTVKGVNSRIRRARQRLRGLFAACCRTEHDESGVPVSLVPHDGCDCPY